MNWVYAFIAVGLILLVIGLAAMSVVTVDGPDAMRVLLGGTPRIR